MKLKLHLFLLFISVGTFAQLPMESFEGIFPPAGWATYSLDSGFVSWQISSLSPHSGTQAAYLNKELIAGGMPEDWLITKQFIVPEDANLTFYSRLALEDDQGCNFIVKICTTCDIDSPAPSSYYVLLDNWTELQLNPQAGVYREITVPIPEQYEGLAAYIAFIMIGNSGDRWFLDDISVSGDSAAGISVSSEKPQTIHPNPVRDLVTIQGIDQIESIDLYDMNGRKYDVILNGNQLNVESIAAGIYLMNITADGGIFIHKLVKE